MRLNTNGIQVFLTSTTRLRGVGPTSLMTGDRIVTFQGAEVPFAVRCMGNGHYKLLDEVHVLGIIHGEYMKESLVVESFVLETPFIQNQLFLKKAKAVMGVN